MQHDPGLNDEGANFKVLIRVGSKVLRLLEVSPSSPTTSVRQRKLPHTHHVVMQEFSQVYKRL